MLRIGVMLDSFHVRAWEEKFLTDLEDSGFATIVLIVRPPAAPAGQLAPRTRSSWRNSLYHRYLRWDETRLRADFPADCPADVSALLGHLPSVSPDQLDAIRAARLDVLFQLGSPPLRGPILDAARFGVWAFRHGNSLNHRPERPLLREVYDGHPVLISTLNILRESPAAEQVIYRGYSATCLTSVAVNRNALHWKAPEFALRRLRALDLEGHESLPNLPPAEDTQLAADPLPTHPRMIPFLLRQASRRLHAYRRNRGRGTRVQWALAYRTRGAASFADPSGYTVIRPPRDRFYADPFLFDHHGHTWVFFEDFRYADSRGVISCAQVLPDGSIGSITEVLRQPYHLSYPFLLEFDGHIYMIPETHGNRTIELYRATTFPHAWEPAGLLLSGLDAVDATIIHRDGKLWMFAGTTNGLYSPSEELSIFYADTLLGPWTPHRLNPVISDVRRARPAGALFEDAGRLIRPAQNSAQAYGHTLCFYEVLVLNEYDYQERLIDTLEPAWQPRNLGTHSYSRNDRFEFIDCNFPPPPLIPLNSANYPQVVPKAIFGCPIHRA